MTDSKKTKDSPNGGSFNLCRKFTICLLMISLWFITPSFISDKENDRSVITLQDSSITVNLKSEVTLKDSRNNIALENKFTSQALSNLELIGVVKDLTTDFKEYTTILKEERSESFMDLTKRKTGFDEQTINKILQQDRLTNIIYSILSIIFILAILIIYSTSFRRLKVLVLVPIFLTLVGYVIILILLRYLLPSIYGIEYQQFFQIIYGV